MKKMKDSRTSSIVFIDRSAGIYLADPDHLAVMYFLQCIFRNEYQYIFSEGMEHQQLHEAVSFRFCISVSAVVSEYIYHCMLYMCDFHYVRTDGCICNICYEIQDEKTADEHGSYPESVSWYAGNDCSLLHTEIF